MNARLSYSAYAVHHGAQARGAPLGIALSIALIIFLVGIVAAFIGFAPGILGEKWVEAFGKHVNRWADGAHHSLAGFGKAVVGGLLLTVACIFGGVVTSFGDESAPVSLSEKYLNKYVATVLTVLKYEGFVLGGLIGLAIAVAVIILLLWLAARLLAVIPVTSRSVAIAAFVFAVVVCVAGYITVTPGASRR